jgi:hypothetical protein
VRRILFPALLLATLSILAADQSDPRFEKWLNESKQTFATNHLIAHVRLAHIDQKGPPFEFRYDRYPEGIERVQKPDGTALAHQKGKKWKVSDDWGKTGEEVDPDVAKQTEGMIAYVNIPLSNKHESRDKSQGADVVRLIDRRTTKDGNEEIIFEAGREHQNPDANYPKFTFFHFKPVSADAVYLSEFSGPVYDVGGGKVQVDVRYQYTIEAQVNGMNVEATVGTPPPNPK